MADIFIIPQMIRTGNREWRSDLEGSAFLGFYLREAELAAARTV